MKTLTENAKICSECGSLKWFERFSSTQYAREYYSPTLNGEVRSNFEVQEEYNTDWEEDGDPECSECGSLDLIDLENLTPEQILELENIEDQEERVDAANTMLSGVYISSTINIRKNLIGGKVIKQ